MTEAKQTPNSSSANSADQNGTSSLAIQRIQQASDLFDFAFQIKHFQLKTRNPHMTERELYVATMNLIDAACARW